MRIGVSMIFGWSCGSLICGSWCELLVASERTLGVFGAEL
jgi:hypothetical protein